MEEDVELDFAADQPEDAVQRGGEILGLEQVAGADGKQLEKAIGRRILPCRIGGLAAGAEKGATAVQHDKALAEGLCPT